MERMRGPDGFTESTFTVLKLDEFVPKDHPLRPIRSWLNDLFKGGFRTQRQLTHLNRTEAS
jgi:hypothetical protein